LSAEAHGDGFDGDAGSALGIVHGFTDRVRDGLFIRDSAACPSMR
jgi:hypothetical protein